MIDLIRKIEAKIHKYPSGCWIWEGNWNGNRPDFRYKRKRVMVAETLYGWQHGCFPPKKLHRCCLNLKCVRPLHHSTNQPEFDLSEELPADTELGDITRIATPKDTEMGDRFAPESHFFVGDGFGKFIQAKKEALTRRRHKSRITS